jgi:hypothetical protein
MGREKFSALDMLSKRSLPERKEKQAIIYKDPRELVPTQENFYTTKNISKLKASIKITGYLMQPILIENVDGKDKVLAGHRRRLCCIELIEEGDTRFEKVPCMYAAEINVSEDKELTPEQREAITPFLRQFKVIQANNYRDKNDWERMQEALEMEKIVKGLKEKVGITGTVRENLKELLGVSNAQFGRYKNISNHLSEELMEEFQDGEINISVADAAASLKPELQKLAYEMYMKNKILTLPDIQLLKDQQALNADIPGQMTIEQATRQQKPEEDETLIPVELQIERFFDSLKKNTTARIRNGDKLMGTKMISMLYCYVKHRNGYLNYQGHPDRITFNPDSPEEKEMTWQELTEELIRRYSTKKPVKMTTIDAPEKPKQKEEHKVEIKKPDGKATAYLNYAAEHLIHSWRDWFIEDYHKRVISVSESPKEIKKKIAGQSREWHFSTGTGVASINLFDEYVQIWNEKAERIGNFDWFYLAKSIQSMWNAVALEETKKSCQPAAETPDKKQQEDHTGETTEMVKDIVNTDLPAAWPEKLKDIPIPSTGDLSIYLQKQEDLLKRMTEVEKEEAGFPELVIKKQQMLVAGLRILKNLVEDCQEEPEQPGLPIMKNNDQRKEWLRNYKSWGLWYTDNHTGVKYYKCDFENGACLIVEEYEKEPLPENSWYVPEEPYYMHLIGGPEPDRKGGIPKWTYHSKYNKYPNSETELVEFLKEIQK